MSAPDPSDEPMSALDLRAWLDRSSGWLAERGVDATSGCGPRLTSEGATWISFSSRWGSGRVVRAADGTSTRVARRHAEGTSALAASASTTCESHLVEVVAAIGAPPPVASAR